jgi:hypothetical protein
MARSRVSTIDSRNVGVADMRKIEIISGVILETGPAKAGEKHVVKDGVANLLVGDGKAKFVDGGGASNADGTLNSRVIEPESRDPNDALEDALGPDEGGGKGAKGKAGKK